MGSVGWDKFLNNIQEQDEEITTGKVTLLIDGLNLFFRNFAALNMINPQGAHIGGLGGFFRSLGSLIRQFTPDDIYVIFDGAGSSDNRKNLISEYKSTRNHRVTKWEIFDSLEEEDNSKINQIVRIVQYLKTLPVKIISLDKVEADDIIAYLSQILPKTPEDKVVIVSSDKDFIQLISNQIIVYSPIDKIFHNPENVLTRYGVLPENFILYKTLLGDTSDNIEGIRGLGKKGLIKNFPDLGVKKVDLDYIYDVSEAKYQGNMTCSRIIQKFETLRIQYKVMDLRNPMLDNSDKTKIDQIVNSQELNFFPNKFIRMHQEDGLGGIIKDVNFWVKNIFSKYKV